MGVTLERAWAICALLEEADAERGEQDVARALVLTSETSGSGKNLRTQKALHERARFG